MRKMNNWLMFFVVACFSGAAVADVDVANGWVTKPIGLVKNVAAYMDLKNEGAASVKLVGVNCGFAKHCELHTIIHKDGMAIMRKLSGLDLPPGQLVQLKPGGLHVMVIGVTETLKESQTVQMELETEQGGRIPVKVRVRDRLSVQEH